MKQFCIENITSRYNHISVITQYDQKIQMIVEICANSYQSALNAEKAGANRIELCSELAVGGITPSYGLIKKVVNELSIPVHVLIRPRSGDFTYSDAEFEVMKTDILMCKELGCKGIVSGILHRNNDLDLERTKLLVEESGELSFTFHRAFDWVNKPLQAIKDLSKIGVDRILSSGQELSAEYGIDLLKQLHKASLLKIIPGGGIHRDNVLLFKENGFEEIHLSATQLQQTIEIPKISMNSLKHFEETQLAVSNTEVIKNIISLLNV